MSARLIMKLDVVDTQDLGAAVRRVVLRHPRRAELPAPEPGGHVDVRLSDGRVRQYSLCGDPADATHYVIAVKREPQGRGGSQWIHEHLVPGAVAHVSAPRNHFALVDNAAHHLLVGGGIGITPLVAMAWHLHRTRASFQLHYCAPDPAAAPLLDELRDRLGPRLSTHFSRVPDAGRFDAVDVLGACPLGSHVYCCGPERLVRSVREAAADWPIENVHVEAFVPPSDGGSPSLPFEVAIRSSGQLLAVPADRSALAVLREAGFLLPSSCEIGVCGACECQVLNGRVLHRGTGLGSNARRPAMLLCVSRAEGRVTLDL